MMQQQRQQTKDRICTDGAGDEQSRHGFDAMRWDEGDETSRETRSPNWEARLQLPPFAAAAAPAGPVPVTNPWIQPLAALTTPGERGAPPANGRRAVGGGQSLVVLGGSPASARQAASQVMHAARRPPLPRNGERRAVVTASCWVGCGCSLLLF